MLKLENITKSYTTGSFTQVALDGVSVAFRDSEFVAILGPSGSGKTTMLNIIGGLDHYDSGNLIIDGISTKDYKDRDWDAFRNNRVGFVFQSYNLIPHQTILANVELALTLSGVGKEERRRRAAEALEKVGLGKHINKRPSQLSGGQMQRVAIARALINDPEILLADEPTGALDSKTSVQIMDLLTEIAEERLVVMVTHNPELAEEYATRIVNLADGHITNDTNPFEPAPEDMRRSRKKVRRTSMSFLTALSLSFNNLMTKKARTIMTAVAGSIGIIGIAAILSLANGVNGYIKSVEEETLSSYPLQITSTGFDMTSMMTMSMGGVADSDSSEDGDSDDGSASQDSSAGSNVEDTQVKEVDIMNRMFDSVGSNDLASLKEFLDSGESGIDEYATDIEYQYNVTPYVYIVDEEDDGKVQQINPDTSLNSLGMGSGMSSSGIMSQMMSTDMFAEMSGTIDMAKDSYDLKAGHWPESYNECVLVLTSNGGVSDFLLYVLGLRDRDVMEEMIRAFANDEEIVTEVGDGKKFTYSDFLNLDLKLVCSADFYQYDEEFDVWVDKSSDDAYMRDVVANSGNIVISGIIQPKDDSKSMSMGAGIYYTPDLTQHLIDEAGQTQIVKDQLADPSKDVFSGKSFAEEEESGSDFDMSSMFSIDTGALQAAFTIDTSKLNVDMSSLNVNIDSSTLPQPPAFDMSSMEGATGSGSSTAIQPDMAEVANMMNAMMPVYATWVAGGGASGDIAAFLQTPEAAAVIAEYMPKMLDTSAMMEQTQQQIQAAMQQYMQSYMTDLMTALTSQMQEVMTTVMTKATSQIGASMASAMSINEEAFKDAFQFDMSEEELAELMMSMMQTDTASFDNNLAKLDYAQLDKPYEIDIFAKDFDAKEHITGILDDYNDLMNSTGQEAKAITYTDLVGALMSSVTTIIDMISYVLIAFVSISLVVSSIMIGVITYISVLERKKEIGILRAIGASKFNVSEIFNAETIIEGLISGILGVGVTALCCIPASAIVYALFDVPNIASLPWQAGVALVIISVVLTFVAGLLPARSASKRDPVEALRSE